VRPAVVASSRTLEHVGEWRIEISGETLPEVFAEMARLIANAVGTSAGPHREWEQLEVSARDPATLLVDFANELVSRSEINARAYDELRYIDLRTDGQCRIRAQVRGRPVTGWRSPLKAATYHDVSLVREPPGWHARVLFDV
jgi:SHS2 domain-containing protein